MTKETLYIAGLTLLLQVLLITFIGFWVCVIKGVNSKENGFMSDLVKGTVVINISIVFFLKIIIELYFKN